MLVKLCYVNSLLSFSNSRYVCENQVDFVFNLEPSLYCASDANSLTNYDGTLHDCKARTFPAVFVRVMLYAAGNIPELYGLMNSCSAFKSNRISKTQTLFFGDNNQMMILVYCTVL